MQQTPPPPAPEPKPRKANDLFTRLLDLHLPRTNIFKAVRTRLAALERPPFFRDEMEPYLGLIGALVISGFATMLVSLGTSATFPSLYAEGQFFGPIILSPFAEETTKACSVLAVGLVLPRVFPNRRYGAAMGAAAGLGYALAEDISYFSRDLQPSVYVLRLIHNPFGHPVYTAFSGIGVFVLLSQMQKGKKFFEALLGLPLILFVVGLAEHSLWNFMQKAAFWIWDYPYASYILGFLLVLFPFLFILRDFLGGRFNFRHFFQPLPESASARLPIPPPPPDQGPLQTASRAQIHVAQLQQVRNEEDGRYV